MSSHITFSIYDLAEEFKHLPPDEFYEKVDSLTNGVFEDIWRDGEFSTPEQKKMVMLYIIFGYSYNSPMVVLGSSSAEQKKTWAARAGIPDYLFGPVVKLQSETVRSTVLSYLSQQTDRDFYHLSVKKLQYESLMGATVENTVNDKGETDYSLLYKITDLADKLLEDINAFEDKIKAKYGAYKKNNEDEIQAISERVQATSLNVEQSQTIKDRRRG